QEPQERDWIGEVDAAVVVDVRAVQTDRPGSSPEEPVEEEERIADVHGAVPIRVASAEGDSARLAGGEEYAVVSLGEQVEGSGASEIPREEVVRVMRALRDEGSFPQ